VSRNGTEGTRPHVQVPDKKTHIIKENKRIEGQEERLRYIKHTQRVQERGTKKKWDE
jgi:hypothetical protein